MNTPADYIRALVCGLPSPLRENRLLVMLVGYVDDSGSEPDGYAFVLGGFVSTADKWEKFSDEWDALCKKDPPTLDFKMGTAERLKGVGTYWGQGTLAELAERRDAKVQALAALIKKYAICRLSAGMDWHNYKALAKGRVPPNVDSPYFFLFWELCWAVAQHQHETGVNEKVDFLFDYQGAFGDTAVFWHAAFIETFPPFEREILSNPPSFRHDKDVVPLKAADMLAWHMHRYLMDKEKDRQNGVVTELRPALRVLLELPQIKAHIDGERLKYIVRAVNGLED